MKKSMTCARSRRYRWSTAARIVRVAESDLVRDTPARARDNNKEGGRKTKEETGLVCATCFESGRGVIECSECHRGFHAYGGHGCNPLRLYPEEVVEVLELDSFKCPNCTTNRHQCHSCKKEGKPNKTLFKCLLSNCNLFHCIECQRGVPRRTICPRHICAECNLISSKSNPLIECERCSVSYHRDCLPDSLFFNRRVRHEERKLICTKHQEEGQRDGVRFPDDMLAQWRQTTLKEFRMGIPCRILERVDPPNLRYMGQPPSPMHLGSIDYRPFRQSNSKIPKLQASTSLDQRTLKPPVPEFDTPGMAVVVGRGGVGGVGHHEDLVPMGTFWAPVTIYQPFRATAERPVNCDSMPALLNALPWTPSTKPCSNSPSNYPFRADGDGRRDRCLDGCRTLTLSSVSKAVNHCTDVVQKRRKRRKRWI
ncbi:hypothetical protein BSKO_08213 [Bryopsis sp. KO-2023]|nr:hypothetical protein BSKO_08213 [Bryopsis sp. KO-2023]